MSNKKTAAELLFQICSYEHLGAAANYEHDNQPGFSDFNAHRYLDARNKNDKNILSNAIHERESCRKFCENQVSVTMLQEILFNSYSLKNDRGSYTIPQAGGLPTMNLIVLDNTKSEEIKLYNYNPKTYELNYTKSLTTSLEALFYSKSIDFNSANYCMIICADLQTLSKQYLARGFKFACFQAGHIAQNILLNAAALDISAISLGSLIEKDISTHCLSTEDYPLYAVVM